MYPVKGKIAFVILLCLVFFFFSWQLRADSPQKTTPGVEYQSYEGLEGREYQQFLSPLPEGKWYWTRMKGVGNVDNTPEKEEVVLITLQDNKLTEIDYGQAFLLVCTKREGALKKKYLLEIYDNTKKEFIENPYPPMVLKKGWQFFPYNGKIELVDLNHDGILDVFIELWSTGIYSTFYVAVVSFQNSDLKKIFSSFAGAGDYSPKYLDIDGDGLYELQIPDEIYVEGFEHAASPEWISLYEWNGKEYVLNNQKFYSRNPDFLISLLQLYNSKLQWYCNQLLWGGGDKQERYFEDYEFYLGLIYYYRGNLYAARNYFLRIVEKAKNENYAREAKAILKQLAETGNPDFAPRNK